MRFGNPITAGYIAALILEAGEIVSANYVEPGPGDTFAVAGTRLDLTNGELLSVGIAWDGAGQLDVRGDITATSLTLLDSLGDTRATFEQITISDVGHGFRYFAPEWTDAGTAVYIQMAGDNVSTEDQASVTLRVNRTDERSSLAIAADFELATASLFVSTDSDPDRETEGRVQTVAIDGFSVASRLYAAAFDPSPFTLWEGLVEVSVDLSGGTPASTITLSAEHIEIIGFVREPLHIGGTGAAMSTLGDVVDAATPNLWLTGAGMNTTTKYTAGLVFGSTDPDFTTRNPKPLALIVGEATTTYNDDADGGMILVFATTAGNPGTDPVPVEVMTLSAAFLTIVDPVRLSSVATYNATGATAANLFIASNGNIARSTSSRRFKVDVEPIDVEHADRVLDLAPVWFRSIASEDRRDWSHYGFIAEQVAEIDPRLVHWGTDDAGELVADGVQYDRVVPGLVDVVRRLTERVRHLEQTMTPR